VNGDGWVVAGDGELRWGLYGAAGLLLRYGDRHANSIRFLLAQRSAHVHHGGTWGIPGGALHRGESAEDGARREFEEEFAAVRTNKEIVPTSPSKLPTLDYTVAELIVDDAGNGWTYTTVLADVDEPVVLEPASWEHTRTRWATVAEMAHLVLHPGLAGLLPRL
jgi:8-oxo-dGTP diphosphatase